MERKRGEQDMRVLCTTKKNGVPSGFYGEQSSYGLSLTNPKTQLRELSNIDVKTTPICLFYYGFILLDRRELGLRGNAQCPYWI